MNRRQFFTAAPALLATPLVPKPKENLLPGAITIWNGKEHIPVSYSRHTETGRWSSSGNEVCESSK